MKSSIQKLIEPAMNPGISHAFMLLNNYGISHASAYLYRFGLAIQQDGLTFNIQSI